MMRLALARMTAPSVVRSACRVRASPFSSLAREDELFEQAQALWNAPGKRKESFAIIHEAASLGHQAATVIVGDAYLNGDKEAGVDVDEQKAFDYYTTASSTGYIGAHTRVAECYLKGKGVEANNHRAAEFLEKGSAGGDPDAKAFLGVFYYSGAAAAKDPVMASELFLAALKNPDCTQRKQAEKHLFTIANHFYNGHEHCRQDQTEAFRFLDAMLPYTEAPITGMCEFMLATCYAEGAGVEMDDEKALQYLELSAANGCQHGVDSLQRWKEQDEEEEAELVEVAR